MKKSPYKNITILGPGLLGGSLGLAIKAKFSHVTVTAWAREGEPLEPVLYAGAADKATDNIREAVEKADLVVLTTPIGVMGELAKKMIPHLKPEVLVTDVGSVKKVVHKQVGSSLTKAEISFIGSHPMAGSEKQGITVARANLFHRAPLVLTNDEEVEEKVIDRLSRFWENLGCLTYRMEAAHHDRCIAQISHLTHLISGLASRTGITPGEEWDLGLISGGGFRDTTRVSSGNPEMWSEIIKENREALRPLIENAVNDLLQLRRCLEGDGDREKIKDWLSEAKEKREKAMESCALGSIDDSTV